MSTDRVLAGKKAKAVGSYFEDMISYSCRLYEDNGIAKIEKQNEPIHYIRSLNRGQFIANFAKKSGVDYKGVLKGGKTICFECKHTDNNSIPKARVESHQLQYMNDMANFGALCFVVVSFRLERFYVIPLKVWTNMQTIYGRVSLKEELIQEFKVPKINAHGVDFLASIDRGINSNDA